MTGDDLFEDCRQFVTELLSGVAAVRQAIRTIARNRFATTRMHTSSNVDTCTTVDVDVTRSAGVKMMCPP